jgi:predicted deacylase
VDIKTIHEFDQIDFDRPGKSFYELAFIHDGNWASIMFPLIVINGENGAGKGIGAFGGTHGNEYEGQVAILRLAHELDPREMSGRVILIPRLNPPACAAGTRESPLDRGNMNRAFPGDAGGTITYRISHFVSSIIFPQIEVVLDMHAGGTKLRFPVAASCLEVPDPALWQETVRVAFLFDTPFIGVGRASFQLGTLTGHASSLGKVSIGGEFGYCRSVHLAGVRHVYEGIKNVLRHYGNLPGKVQKVDPTRDRPPILLRAAEAEDFVPSPFSGVFEPVVDVGHRVRKGDLLGRLYNFERIDHAPVEIRSRRDGYVLMLEFEGPVQKGDWIYVVGQETPPPFSS